MSHWVAVVEKAREEMQDKTGRSPVVMRITEALAWNLSGEILGTLLISSKKHHTREDILRDLKSGKSMFCGLIVEVVPDLEVL